MIKRSLKRKEDLQKISADNSLSKKMIRILDKDISESILKELKDEETKEEKLRISKEEFLNNIHNIYKGV